MCINYILTRSKKVILSGRLSEFPVSAAEAVSLIGKHIVETGQNWEIPLDEEIIKAWNKNRHDSTDIVWVLDGSRSFVGLNLFNWAHVHRDDLPFRAENDRRFHVYAVRIEYTW